MQNYNYDENKVYQPKKFPFVSSKRLDYNPGPNIIPRPTYIAQDEVFVWLTHSAVTPNVLPYRYLISNYGRMWDNVSNQEKIPCPHTGGYLKTKILYFSSDNQVDQLDVFMHRLVAFYFLYFPHCENLQVNHISGIKTDNRVCNLEWVTPSQNMDHASKHGLLRVGEDHPRSKLTNEQVERVCQMIVEGKSNSEIAPLFGVDATLISAIRSGGNYNFIASKYDVSKYKKEVSEKLSDDQVDMICQLITGTNMSLDKIASIVGCTKHQIHSIRFEGRYKRITDNYDLKNAPLRKNRPIDADKNEIHKICHLLEQGYQPAEISRMDGITLNSKQINGIKGGDYPSISKQYNIPKPIKREGTPEEKVREICEILQKNDGKTAQEIANMTNVAVNVVQHIKHKKIYKNIVSEYNIPEPRSIDASLSVDKVREICEMIQRFPNMEIRKIAGIFGIGEHRVARIKNRDSFTEISKDYKW